MSDGSVQSIIPLLLSLQLQQKILECDRKGPRNTSIPLGEALQLPGLMLRLCCPQQCLILPCVLQPRMSPSLMRRCCWPPKMPAPFCHCC